MLLLFVRLLRNSFFYFHSGIQWSFVEFSGGDKSAGKVQGNGKSGIWTFEECSMANPDFESEVNRMQSVSNRRF